MSIELQGYCVKCHSCGAEHRANEICSCYRDLLIQVQSNQIIRAVKKVKKEVVNG